jgi:YegS/Rv2252/BmrU family lipid kinase
MRKIGFIINPISGGKSKINIAEEIQKQFLEPNFHIQIFYTKYKGHARELSQKLIEEQFDSIVAVGGDGTINECVSTIAGSAAKLGIIPRGSGNGLARHLKIPANLKKSIDIIKQDTHILMDYFSIDNHISANVSGFGFDAQVAHSFQNSTKRGFFNYARITLLEFMKYKSKVFKININGSEIIVDAFLISFANSSQFGNNALIAPFANVTDGLLDVVIIKPFPVIYTPMVALRLMTGTLSHSKYYECFKTEHLKISNSSQLMHVDGEALNCNQEVEINIFKQNLKLLIP